MKRALRLSLIVLAIAVVTHVAAVWAVPRVIMHMVVTRSAEAAGGFDRAYHPPPIDDKARWVVLPSPDLRYSICALDLADGPVEVTATPPDNYFSLSVFDAATDNVAVVSNGTTGSGPIHLVIAQHAVPVPAGAHLVTMETTRGLLLLRALAATPEQAAVAEAARRTLDCRRLGDTTGPANGLD